MENSQSSHHNLSYQLISKVLKHPFWYINTEFHGFMNSLMLKEGVKPKPRDAMWYK